MCWSEDAVPSPRNAASATERREAKTPAYKTKGGPAGPPFNCTGRAIGLVAAHRFASHTVGDDADLLDAGAHGRVDDLHDLAVTDGSGPDEEQRLLAARLVNLAELRRRLLDRHFLLVDGQAAVSRVFDDDLTERLGGLRIRVGLER